MAITAIASPTTKIRIRLDSMIFTTPVNNSILLLIAESIFTKYVWNRSYRRNAGRPSIHFFQIDSHKSELYFWPLKQIKSKADELINLGFFALSNSLPFFRLVQSQAREGSLRAQRLYPDQGAFQSSFQQPWQRSKRLCKTCSP